MSGHYNGRAAAQENHCGTTVTDLYLFCQRKARKSSVDDTIGLGLFNFLSWGDAEMDKAACHDGDI